MKRAQSKPVHELPSWLALQRHHDRLARSSLRHLFAAHPDRAAEFTAEADGLILDYSKNILDADALRALVEVAQARELRAAIEAMCTGQPINSTEGRAVLHVALRSPQDARIIVNGVDVVSQVHHELERMTTFAEQIRSGTWRGYTGKRIRTVVNIGIGGSDLGPAMAYQALTPFKQPDIEVRFVSNVDGADLMDAVADLDQAETLYIVVSKTFTTSETLTNARTACRMLVKALGSDDAVPHHFVAVSTAAQEIEAFGVDQTYAFSLWDWVGGRYSLDSAVGLSLMIAIGPENFRHMLDGFRSMDEHFRKAAFHENLPVLMALIGIWHNNLSGAETHAVLPYSHHLARFPAYLQQLDMESNGKRVDTDGRAVLVQTAPIVWGEPGTNGQHAFFQLIHQGTKRVPCDFIGFLRPLTGSAEQHRLLMANCFAQTEALAFGRSEAEVQAAGIPPELVPHRVFPGNRPSNTIIGHALTPFVLGQLVSLYEHKTFVQGVIWGVNSFDQWGVELGKQLASGIALELATSDEPILRHDESTNALIRRYRDAASPMRGEERL